VSYDLLRTTEGILQQVKQQVVVAQKKQLADQRLSRGIIEILESDDDTPQNPKKDEDSDDEIVFRVPSPICVADLEEAARKKAKSTVNVADDDSDVEVIEHDARSDVIEIRESPERETSSGTSTTATSRVESPVIQVPQVSRFVFLNIFLS
jgi:hypothetical protein